MRKVAAVVVVLVFLVVGAAAFLRMREAECQRELVESIPKIEQIVDLVSARARIEVERAFLAEVAGNATYKDFAQGKPPEALISFVNTSRGSTQLDYLGSHSEDWHVQWSTPYPDTDYSRSLFSSIFPRVNVDLTWHREWHFIPLHPRVDIVDHDDPQNAFFVQQLTRELDALGITYRVTILQRGK